ncbi:MAG: helix-turn-helix transcriptional regulator [Eubacteriales bacterium]|nr:helix-turn-helix transcriptional regulator [Eubacteriales bacterium]
MTIGEKIKERRNSLGLTQAALASDQLTRNMICAIESGKASPSLKTLLYLSKRLDVSIRYFTEPQRTLREELHDSLYPHIRDSIAHGKYDEVAALAEKIPEVQNDAILAPLLAMVHLTLAEQCAAGGSVHYAKSHLEQVAFYRQHTAWDTSHLGARAILCDALVSDPLTPKYALNPDLYLTDAAIATDAELYHYITDDWNYSYTTRVYALHTEAKRLMKEYRFTDAIARMEDAIENKQSQEISVLVLYRIYADMEICYRERKDYENAYRYSSKKNVLLTSFHS